MKSPKAADSSRLGGLRTRFHVESLSFQCRAHLLHVLGHAFKVRPPCRVVAHPDHERVALFVEADQFACFGLDLDALDPTLNSENGWGQQEHCQRQQGEGASHLINREKSGKFGNYSP